MGPSDCTHPDGRIANFAIGQGGVVAIGQLRAVGLTDRRIKRRVASGHLYAHHEGVYAVGYPLLHSNAEGRRWAAVLACGSGAAVSHWSCAVHRGLLIGEGARVDVVVPTGRFVARPGITVRRAVLEKHEVEEVRGLRCTSVPRLLLELSATKPRSVVERVWRQAVYGELLDIEGVAELLTRRRGERGIVRLRSLYDRRLDIVGRFNGNTEELLLPIIRDSVLGEPRVNEPIWVGYRWVTVDFYFPSLRLAIEGDGRLAHADPEAEAEDALRDAELTAIDIHVHRVTWDDARWRRHHVLATFNALASR